MANLLPLAALLLLSFTNMVTPFGFGWFDYDDDDLPVNATNSTLSNMTMPTSRPLFNCQAVEDVFTVFNDFYDFLDQTFNPFYESPTPAPVFNFTTTPRPNNNG